MYVESKRLKYRLGHLRRWFLSIVVFQKVSDANAFTKTKKGKKGGEKRRKQKGKNSKPASTKGGQKEKQETKKKKEHNVEEN